MEYCNSYFEDVCADPPFMGMEEKSLWSPAAALGSLLQRNEHPSPNLTELHTPGTIAVALGSLQHLCSNPSLHTMLTTDPMLLPMNEQRSANMATLQQFCTIAATPGGGSVHQSPQPVSYQTNPFPTDVANNSPFHCGGEAASDSQCMQLCSFSSDIIPQLISDFSTQRACMYSASSECLNDADSSCSSEQERLLPTPCLTGFSSGEICWQDPDALQGNFGDSVPGLVVVEAKQHEKLSVTASDIDAQQSSTQAFGSLAGQPGTPTDCASLLPPPWTSPDLLDVWDRLMISGGVNQEVLTLDPPLASANASANGLLCSSNPPYKRQKVCRMDSVAPENWSQPTLSFSQNNLRSDLAKAGAPLNIHGALYNDFPVSTKRIPYMPKPAIDPVDGRLSSQRGITMDQGFGAQRKQNATSIEPQSMAARHRRKKISERVRVVEKLIPGGSKLDTASMLDEAIEYVKFLQLQVQLLESFADNPDDSPDKGSSASPEVNENVSAKSISSSFAPASISQSSTAQDKARAAASPLILTETLQHQLFKQKLCLASLRQCPVASQCLTSRTSEISR